MPQRCFVGGIRADISEAEVRNLFGRFGDLLSVDIGFPGFLFVEFGSSRDAEQAMQALDGTPLFRPPPRALGEQQG